MRFNHFDIEFQFTHLILLFFCVNILQFVFPNANVQEFLQDLLGWAWIGTFPEVSPNASPLSPLPSASSPDLVG